MFRLRVTAGPRAGESLSLVAGKTYVVGRAEQTDFHFPEDGTMSRAHAEIAPDAAGGWILRNKSQHGTLVGAVKVDTERKLTPGDVLTIGGTTVAFEADPSRGAGATDMPTRPPVGAAAMLPPGGNEPKTPPPMPRPIGTPAAPAGSAAAAAGVPVTIAANAGAPGSPAAAGAAGAAGKPGDPAAAAAAAAKKPGNKNLIIAGIVALLFVCCCCPGSWQGWVRYKVYKAQRQAEQPPADNGDAGG